jgi:glycopeptide antibiotics resistance protein
VTITAVVAGAAAFTAALARFYSRSPERAKRAITGVLSVYVLLVVLVTLAPEQPLWSAHEPVNWTLGEEFRVGGMDSFETNLLVRQYLGNAAMFAPIGALGWLASRRALLTVGACSALTIGIECIQQFMAAGRSADIDDVACNAAGSFVGIIFAWAITATVRRFSGSERAESPVHPRSA